MNDCDTGTYLITTLHGAPDSPHPEGKQHMRPSDNKKVDPPVEVHPLMPQNRYENSPTPSGPASTYLMLVDEPQRKASDRMNSSNVSYNKNVDTGVTEHPPSQQHTPDHHHDDYEGVYHVIDETLVGPEPPPRPDTVQGTTSDGNQPTGDRNQPTGDTQQQLPTRDPLKDGTLPLPTRDPLKDGTLPLPTRDPLNDGTLPLPTKDPLKDGTWSKKKLMWRRIVWGCILAVVIVTVTVVLAVLLTSRKQHESQANTTGSSVTYFLSPEFQANSTGSSSPSTTTQNTVNWALTSKGATCTASSEYNSCELALDGVIPDRGLYGWHAAQHSPGSWIEVKFAGTITIQNITLYPLCRDTRQISSITVFYDSTGLNQQYPNLNCYPWGVDGDCSTYGNHELKVKDIKAASIKIRIDEVCEWWDYMGFGEIEVYGVRV